MSSPEVTLTDSLVRFSDIILAFWVLRQCDPVWYRKPINNDNKYSFMLEYMDPVANTRPLKEGSWTKKAHCYCWSLL